MANGPAFDEAVERARENPELAVGCHLVLVGGTPVAPVEEIPSLLDRQNRLPASLGVFVAKLELRRDSRNRLERELRAQIEKIRSNCIEPTHLDSHKHTHAHPQVLEALGRVAREVGIDDACEPRGESSRFVGVNFSREGAGLTRGHMLKLPLRFERGYAGLPRPLRRNTVCSSPDQLPRTGHDGRETRPGGLASLD